MKAIESKTIARNVVPDENKGDLLFTGTVAGGDNADIDQKKDPYVYSTQFSFALLNNNYINSQHRIDRSQQPFDESLFTENLKQDLQTLSADEIVEKYGTHVIVEAFIGLGIHAQFRSVNIAHNKEESVYENALYYVAKMVYDNYSATDVQKKAVTVNYGTTSTFEFKGGDHSLIPSIILKGNEIIRNWKEEEFDRWKESYDVNETLVKLPDNGLIPIYSMINDATLQTEIKEAVVRYIKSKQPECTGTIPLTISEEIGNGICHYNTDRSDCKTIGVLGSLYNKQMDDTYPLFLYSNETGERLSFEGDLECGMTKSGIIGYCYKEKINQDLDMLVEITDGKQYRYILNYGIDYGNNWKVTGSTIYTKRINQL